MDESWNISPEAVLKIEVLRGGVVQTVFRESDPRVATEQQRAEMVCRAMIGAMCMADPKFEELLRAGVAELAKGGGPTLSLEREILSRNLVNKVLGKLLQQSLYVMLGDPGVWTRRERQVRGNEGQDQGIRNN